MSLGLVGDMVINTPAQLMVLQDKCFKVCLILAEGNNEIGIVFILDNQPPPP